MNSLIIGGAGYIGSHVVLELMDKGHDITVFDNLSTGSKKNICDVNFIKGDILNEDALSKAFRSSSFDVVFHFAALKAAGESMDMPGRYAKQNITGSVNVLNAMVENEVNNIIFSSSAAVYGYPHYLPIDEKHPTDPTNFYGFTKLEIERLLHWFSRLKDIRFAALRYFNAAGYDPDGRITELEQNCANLLPVVMETAMGYRSKVWVFGNDYNTSRRCVSGDIEKAVKSDKVDGNFSRNNQRTAHGRDLQPTTQGRDLRPTTQGRDLRSTTQGRDLRPTTQGRDLRHDGTGIRDYIHVTDLAAAHLKAMKYLTENKNDLTINLGTGKGYSVLEVLECAKRVSGTEIPFEITDRRPGDPAELIAVSTDAHQILDWTPGYSDLETILITMWNAYKTAASNLSRRLTSS